MAKPKRILITAESHEVFVVRIGDRSNVRGFCSECEAEVELLTLDEAVSIAGTNARELIRRLEAYDVHSIETASGHLLVCSESLARSEKDPAYMNELSRAARISATGESRVESFVEENENE